MELNDNPKLSDLIGKVSPVKPTLPELAAKLAAEGSADQLATFLESQGIQGIPFSSFSCAIAQYASRETGRVVGVCPRYMYFQGEGGAAIGLVSFYDEEACKKLDEYAPILEFVMGFDRFEYPNLIKEGYLES